MTEGSMASELQAQLDKQKYPKKTTSYLVLPNLDGKGTEENFFLKFGFTE